MEIFSDRSLAESREEAGIKNVLDKFKSERFAIHRTAYRTKCNRKEVYLKRR